MPRFWHNINRFTGGEVAPEVWGRTETDQWPSMVETARNVLSNPRGGMLRRPGLHYVRPTKFPTKNSRLIPFVFSTTQSYILEFGDYYVRFYKDDGWVENIGNVKTYLGDGTSTRFVYPYPDAIEADIEVYDKNGDLIPPANYTITTIVPGANYALPFSDAAWDVDIDSVGSPWVKNGSQVTSPDGQETIMGAEDREVPLGGSYKYTVDVIDVIDSVENISESNASDILLVSGDPAVEVVSANAIEDNDNTITITADALFEDTSGTQTSNFSWELRHNDNVILNGVENGVGSPGFTLSVSVNVTGLFQVDTFSLHVSATENHNQSVPQVSGATTASTVGLSYLIDPDATLGWGIVGGGGDSALGDVDPVIGTLVIIDNDIDQTNTAPAPYSFLFSMKRGRQVVLDNPVLEFNNAGYFLDFTTAPAIGDIIHIVDKSIVPEIETSVHRMLGKKAVGDIFEIQSPYSAGQLEDLYFAQANDVMVICHDELKPRELVRYNPYDWRFEQNEFTGAPWEDGAYNPLDGYPRTCVYYQERLYFGGTVAKPQTLWGSRSADFHDFTPGSDPLKPDDAVEYTIAAYTHEAIEWLSSERVLIIGTSATEHRLAPDQYIATDRLPTVSRMSAYGGAHAMPAFMGNLTVFIQTAGNQVRTFEQSSQSVIEKWDSLELDWKSKHLTEPKIKQITYAMNPYSILLMVTLDGDLLTMTYEPNMGDTAEVGWTQQETDGDFKSVAVIPEDYRDQVWSIVEREGQRYVEFFDETIFSDSVLTYPDKDFPDDPPIQSVGGLEHLEGKTVVVKVDGSTHPDLVVTNGTVILNDYYSKIAIGLKFIPKIKLQRLAIAGEQANLQGQLGRWSEVWLRIVDSAYPLVDGVRAAERKPITPMDTVEPLVTGDVKVYHLGWDRDKQLTITQDLPVPMHVVSVFGVMTTNTG